MECRTVGVGTTGKKLHTEREWPGKGRLDAHFRDIQSLVTRNRL